MRHKLKVILTVILIASMSIFLSFGLQSDDAEAAAGSSLGQERQGALSQANYTDGNGMHVLDGGCISTEKRDRSGLFADIPEPQESSEAASLVLRIYPTLYMHLAEEGIFVISAILFISFGTILVRTVYPIRKRREETGLCFLTLIFIERKQGRNEE
ncbi:MAG: hypothetical protein ACLTLQ_05150 [[Clostridium] scindens]